MNYVESTMCRLKKAANLGEIVMARSMNKRDRKMRKIHNDEISRVQLERSRRTASMKLVQALDGTLYVCDQDVAANKDLAEQGCIEYEL
jgi:hypothetical protein